MSLRRIGSRNTAWFSWKSNRKQVEQTRQFRTSLPPRVLHVIENLNRGAVENWLVRMLRHARRRNVGVDWTFYCSVGQPGEMEGEARALGARVISSPVPLARKVQFIRALRIELQRGSYNVFHCHHDLLSAVYLLAAAGLPIRRRIVHVHNADETVPTPNRFKQCLYRESMRRICLAMADRVIGNSNHTLDTFLAGRSRRPGRDVVHYYGVDSTPFENMTPDRAGFRRQLGLAENALILLFAGRLVPEKNPVFATDVLGELQHMNSQAVAVFAGAGSQEEAVVARARELGIDNSVRLLGWRRDVPEIMGCSDWFILPHPEQPMEGFGLAVVEAQLAGLRMLLSCGIPDDPLLPAASFRRLSLSAGPKAWAGAAVELSHAPTPSRGTALAALRQSPAAMDRALDALVGLYT
jgi:glycosyltransferase involved in cell wall biosynthesis